MATNTIVEAPTSIKPQPQSQLLSIPGEARKMILEHALPSKRNLILDPQVFSSFGAPRRLLPQSILDAAALLRVSKQVYHEAVPLLYSENIPTIMTPIAYGVLDSHLPIEALVSIKKLEVAIKSKLWEMGSIWDSLVRVLPSTTELVLNFQSSTDMLDPIGELMCRASKDQTFSLKLELRNDPTLNNYNIRQRSITDEPIQTTLDWSRIEAMMYDLKPVPHLKTIIVKAFLPTKARSVFADYQDDHLHWKFSKDGDRDTNTARYLVWEEVTTT